MYLLDGLFWVLLAGCRLQQLSVDYGEKIQESMTLSVVGEPLHPPLTKLASLLLLAVKSRDEAARARSGLPSFGHSLLDRRAKNSPSLCSSWEHKKTQT